MSDQIIAINKVVSIEYVLTDPSGKELDKSSSDHPFLYLHGKRNIVPGLEAGLEGKKPGDELVVKVSPDQGYGVRQKVKAQPVLRSKFPPEAKVEKGAQFLMQGPDGKPVAIWVTKVMGRQVHVTGQHPLAGVTLHFDVKVLDVRDATEEELAHGHPHGPGGHDHGEEEESPGDAEEPSADEEE